MKYIQCLFLVALVALVAGYGVAVHADTRPAAFTNTWQLKPQAIPTSLTNICGLVGTTNVPPCGRDLYACTGDVNQSPNAAVLNITIKDNQASAVPYWDTVPLSGATASVGSGYKLFDSAGDTGCRWFPGGISVQASGVGAFVQMSGKY